MYIHILISVKMTAQSLLIYAKSVLVKIILLQWVFILIIIFYNNWKNYYSNQSNAQRSSPRTLTSPCFDQRTRRVFRANNWHGCEDTFSRRSGFFATLWRVFALRWEFQRKSGVPLSACACMYRVCRYLHTNRSIYYISGLIIRLNYWTFTFTAQSAGRDSMC